MTGKDWAQEKTELLEWLEENDEFELLYEDAPLKKLRRAKEVVIEIEAALIECGQRIKKLGRSGLGVGDTATDESIAAVFYGYIH